MFESYCRHHLYRGVEEWFLNRLITWSTRVRIPPPPDKPEWRNGRRRGLKSLGRKTCEFESHLGYHVHNSLMAFDKWE